MNPPPAPQAVLAPRSTQALLRYGALGAPLAFVALPLYVQWPAHYAERFGLSLAALGLMLLAARGLDAVLDPWLGRRVDAAFARSVQAAWGLGAAACALVLAGFSALFLTPRSLAAAGTEALWAWAFVALLVTYLGYSTAQILHQSWGSRLPAAAAERVRLTAAREGLAVLGVLLASVLPTLAPPAVVASVLAALLGLGCWSLARGPRPAAAPQEAAGPAASPWRDPAVRRLLAVHLLNALASAVPATLLLFFVRDRLQQPAAEAPSLLLYFAAAVLSVPLWSRAARHLGLVRSWGLGLLVSVLAFVWTAALGAGDAFWFGVICVLSGLALGADLTLPAALLAGLVARRQATPLQHGSCFGWWNLVSKLALALAAGITLPGLQWLGYAPGQRGQQALLALSLGYGVLPCLLKLAAGLALWRWRGHWHEADVLPSPTRKAHPT